MYRSKVSRRRALARKRRGAKTAKAGTAQATRPGPKKATKAKRTGSPRVRQGSTPTDDRGIAAADLALAARMLAKAERRIPLDEKALQRLAQPKDPSELSRGQMIRYDLFETYLESAGYARALGRSSEWQRSLARAAALGPALFGQHRALPRAIVTYSFEHDPETLAATATNVIEVRHEVDDSLANAATWLAAMEAALVSGADESCRALAALSAEAYRARRARLDPAVLSFADALRLHTAGDLAGARRHLEATVRLSRVSAFGKVCQAQARALEALSAGDRRRFEEALCEIRAAHERAYAADPGAAGARLLELPFLAMKALGRNTLASSGAP